MMHLRVLFVFSMADRCEEHENRKINYTEFLVKLGVSVKPGDILGLSTQITEGSEDREQIRRSDQAARSVRMHLSNASRHFAWLIV